MSFHIPALAWTLLHFLWQGAVIAALLAGSLHLARASRPNVRYLLACAAMVAMFAAAAGTFVWLNRSLNQAGPGSSMEPAMSVPASTAAAPSAGLGAQRSFSDYLPALVYVWFAGVVLLSLRTGAGFIVAQRLKRRLAVPLAPDWQERFARLAQRLQIAQTVRACESALAEVPAVVGWFKPVVLVPASALTGLPPSEIEALLAHELAHIRRHDYLVNLLQTAVETLLFYHPAVWWTGQKMRAERENCCDDLAVAVCGDVLTYARALTRLEQLRCGAPAVAMAANSGSLLARIRRLVRPADAVRQPSGDWMTGIAILLSGAAIAGGHVSLPRMLPSAIPPTALQLARPVAFTPAQKRDPLGPAAGQAPEAKSEDQAPSAPRPSLGESSSDRLEQDLLAQVAPQLAALDAQAAQEAQAPQAPSGGFIEGLAAEGLKNLTVDELIAFKIHGVTPEYIRQMKAAGLHPDPDELVSMRIHGVEPAQIAAFKAAGLAQLDADTLVSLRIHGATPEYINSLHAAGFTGINADDVVSMRIHGVTPEFARDIKAVGLGNPSLDDLVSMKIHGVTPEFAREIKSMNLRGLDLDGLVTMKIHGVTTAFVHDLQKHGFKDLDVDQVVKLKQFNILSKDSF